MNNNRQEIEDLIKEFINLNLVSDEARNFYKNKVTSDFCMVQMDGQTLSAAQCLMPQDLNFELKFIKLDSIQRIEISSDGQFGFISFNSISKMKVKGAWGTHLTFNIHSGYVTKVENIWKLGWIQTSQKELKE